jgi:hypothetical protein
MAGFSVSSAESAKAIRLSPIDPVISGDYSATVKCRTAILARDV